MGIFYIIKIGNDEECGRFEYSNPSTLYMSYFRKNFNKKYYNLYIYIIGIDIDTSIAKTM